MLSIYDGAAKEFKLSDGTVHKFYCGEELDDVAITLACLLEGSMDLQQAYVDILVQWNNILVGNSVDKSYENRVSATKIDQKFDSMFISKLKDRLEPEGTKQC